MNLLIIEDDIIMADTIKAVFKSHPLINKIDVIHTYDKAREYAITNIYDFILLDIMLGGNKPLGIELCSIIRHHNKSAVIIMLTGLHSIHYLEKSFLAGANDYITKPFRQKELQLRVCQWKKIMSPQVVFSSKISYKGLEYSLEKNIFYFNNQEIILSKKNKQLLRIFVENYEKVLNENFLREKLWGDYYFDKERNIRANIQLLKKSLKGTCDEWILNVRGEGYVLKKD